MNESLLVIPLAFLVALDASNQRHVSVRLTAPERLAKTSAARVKGYIEASAFAGPYLADQLVLPFVLAGGGAFTLVKPSQHALTAIDIARRFTGRRIELTQQSDRTHLFAAH